tara:strand:- start:22261 stop:22755 length:495 start_codon:yes stop_codon:yes gene_type:complete
VSEANAYARAKLAAKVEEAKARGIKSVAGESLGDLLARAASEAQRVVLDEPGAVESALRSPKGPEGLLIGGLERIRYAAPQLGEIAADELGALLSTGWEAADAGYPEGVRELAYKARRKAFRLVTASEIAAAEARAARLEFLADLLEDLGEIALAALPLLIAAL